jgi:hypothetical protein
VRGNLRVLADEPGLLNPLRHGFRALTLLSRGVLRWLTPVILFVAAAVALPLAAQVPGHFTGRIGDRI